MKELDELVEVSDILMGPGGCPWDREQTFFSLQPFLLEEVHEVIEAIDSKDPEKILEELGDVFYTVIFCTKIAEKEQLFTLKQVITAVKEKLIRRHPHVFSDLQISSIEELKVHWERIKSEEESQKVRKSELDGVPSKMPLIAKAQKMLQKVQKSVDFPLDQFFQEPGKSPEEAWAKKLFTLLFDAERNNLDAESAFRREIKRLEDKYRDFEKSK